MRYAETHYQLAVAACQRRSDFMRQMMVSSGAVVRCEQELCAHLYTLSSLEQREPGARRGELFVCLSSGLMSDSDDRKAKALKLLDKLVEVEATIPPEAEDALILFPSSQVDNWLKALFTSRKDLRADILRVWKHQFADIDAAQPGFLETRIEGDNSQAAQAVIRWHAASPSGRLSTLRTLYERVCEGAVTEISPHAVVAIRGGAMRGDEMAIAALKKAISLAGADQLGALLETCALTGNKEFLPVLASAAGNHGEDGWYWLALHGDVRAAEILISAMEDIRHCQSATRAWILLTGHIPDSRPRLQVVGDDEKSSLGKGNAPPELLPDTEAARRFLLEKRNHWHPGERYLVGEKVNPEYICRLARQFSGKLGSWLTAIAEFDVGRPLGASHRGWRSDVMASLDEWDQSTPAPVRDVEVSAGV